ncbi:hypothetical protein Tco_0361698, partial [Tanacetum coccineum]
MTEELSTTAPAATTTTATPIIVTIIVDNRTRRQEAGRAYAVTSSENGRYAGDLPLCKVQLPSHSGPCTG